MPEAGWHGLLVVAGRTAVIYVVILLGVRLSGKREVGQMTPFDLTLLLLISNSVQNAMVGPDNSLLGGIVAAVTLLVLNYFLAELSGANRRFRKLLQGSPTLLIHNGQMIQMNLAKEHVTVDELMAALRGHSVSCIEEVSLAVLEVDGSISVLRYDDVPASPQHHHRMKFLVRRS